jgi:hypothetical protein
VVPPRARCVAAVHEGALQLAARACTAVIVLAHRPRHVLPHIPASRLTGMPVTLKAPPPISGHASPAGQAAGLAGAYHSGLLVQGRTRSKPRSLSRIAHSRTAQSKPQALKAAAPLKAASLKAGSLKAGSLKAGSLKAGSLIAGSLEAAITRSRDHSKPHSLEAAFAQSCIAQSHPRAQPRSLALSLLRARRARVLLGCPRALMTSHARRAHRPPPRRRSAHPASPAAAAAHRCPAPGLSVAAAVAAAAAAGTGSAAACSSSIWQQQLSRLEQFTLYEPRIRASHTSFPVQALCTSLVV